VRALLYIFGALLAFAVFAAALRAALVVLAIMVFGALIVDPVGTLKRLGSMTIMLLFWGNPVAALLVILAILLAALVTHLAKGRVR
jgi:hypothetical protein